MQEVIFVVKVPVAESANVVILEVMPICFAVWCPCIPFSIVAAPAYLHMFCLGIVVQQVLPRRTVILANFAQVVH